MNKNSPSVSTLAGFARTTPTALGMTNWDFAGPEHPTVATEMRSPRFRKSSSWTSRPGIETDHGPRLTGKCGVENDRFGSGSVYRETDAYQCRQSARQRVRFSVASWIIVGHRPESVSENCSLPPSDLQHLLRSTTQRAPRQHTGWWRSRRRMQGWGDLLAFQAPD